MSERSSLDSLPTTSLGQYQIRSRIGSGGMGDVYDALHTALNKRVAIKTLRKRFLDDEVTVARFLREGQLASRIRHPNIVDVTDVGMIGGLPCLVMEHLDGEPLSAMIRRDGALPITALVDVLLPIVAAVDFAHEQHVLHRDIKPSNIFLARSWNGDVVPKVLDFGISKLVHDTEQQSALTTDSAFVGTPHYASPELMRADKGTDGRSDQYSIGVVLYEGITGVRPFTDKAGSFVALAMAICAGQYPPLRQLKPDVPEALDRVITRAMSLDVAQRFPSMRALGESLLPYASDRARVIWAPAFRDKTSTPAMPAETQVLLRPPISVQVPSVPTYHSASHPSLSVPHGVTPPPGVYSSYTNTTPPASGSFDRSFVQNSTEAGSSGAVRALALPLGGLALAGAVLIAIFVIKQPARTATAAPPPPTATAGAGPSFTVDLTTVPDSAAIEVDGLPAGNGRYARAFPRDGRKHALRVSAPGHEALFVEFDENRPPPARVALRALPTAVVTADRPKPPQPGPGPAHAAPPPKPGPTATKAGGDRPKTDNIDPWE